MFFLDKKNNRGSVLIAFYLVITVLLILGIAFLSRIYAESRMVERQKRSIHAFHIAEGGAERAFYDLRQDYINDADPSWADGVINGMVCEVVSGDFYILPYSAESTSLGDGSYVVELKNVVGKDDEIWIKSTGTVGDITKTIQVYAKMENICPWSNAIFAGTGSIGKVINGNVDIRGSVHILGTGLESYDFALNMNGSGNIGNNYDRIPVELRDRVPQCPTTVFNSEIVETLGATLRIKNGLAALSGTANVGKPDSSGNIYKETMDGAYVTDGYAGDKGAQNVYSDNGTQHKYDLGDGMEFPHLNEPYAGYSTYQDYLRDNALVISDPTKLNTLANITPGSAFNYTDPDGKGSISMDGKGNLNIDGIVYVNGGSLNMDKIGPSKKVLYSGKGSIFVTGNVGINVSLLTKDNNSFPASILGVMTPNDISFNAADIDVMGIFYAEDKITSQKQTNVAGTFVSNYFDMGQNVPSVYYIPELINNLPPGIIAKSPVWYIRVVSWQTL